jgi:hypothetical protein
MAWSPRGIHVFVLTLAAAAAVATWNVQCRLPSRLARGPPRRAFIMRSGQKTNLLRVVFKSAALCQPVGPPLPLSTSSMRASRRRSLHRAWHCHSPRRGHALSTLASLGTSYEVAPMTSTSTAFEPTRRACRSLVPSQYAVAREQITSMGAPGAGGGRAARRLSQRRRRRQRRRREGRVPSGHWSEASRATLPWPYPDATLRQRLSARVRHDVRGRRDPGVTACPSRFAPLGGVGDAARGAKLFGARVTVPLPRKGCG